MGFVERELEKISAALREPRIAEDTNEYQRLYAAQQALSWALEPTGFKSPYDLATGIPAKPEDCQASNHPPVS
jgi:hypothetical protein